MIYFMAGQPGVGKSTVARVLQGILEGQGVSTTILSFSDELMKHVGLLNPRLGYPIQEAEGPIDVSPGFITWQGAIRRMGFDAAWKAYPEMGRLARRYDQIVRENFGQDYWARCAFDRLMVADKDRPLRNQHIMARCAVIFEDCPTPADYAYMQRRLAADGSEAEYEHQLWVVAGPHKPLPWAHKHEHWVIHNVRGLDDIEEDVKMCLATPRCVRSCLSM